jgi:hypothetical protein
VRDLDEILEDLTNLEHRVTPLYDHTQPASEPVAQAVTRREFHEYEGSAKQDTIGYLTTDVRWLKQPVAVGTLDLYATPQPAAKPIDKAELKRLVCLVFGDEFQIVRQEAKPARNFIIDMEEAGRLAVSVPKPAQPDLRQTLETALARIEDMLSDDDGQAFKEARKFLPIARGVISGAQAEPVARDEAADIACGAVRKAFALGQTYWQQADSEYTSQHRKADETHAKFKALVQETHDALAASLTQPRPQPMTEQKEPNENWVPVKGYAGMYQRKENKK